MLLKEEVRLGWDGGGRGLYVFLCKWCLMPWELSEHQLIPRNRSPGNSQVSVLLRAAFATCIVKTKMRILSTRTTGWSILGKERPVRRSAGDIFGSYCLSCWHRLIGIALERKYFWSLFLRYLSYNFRSKPLYNN